MAVAHIDDDALEAYSMGRLAEAEAAPIEEHLLVCPLCQDRFAEWDTYIRSMQSAMRRIAGGGRGSAA
jgi:anti-sigma factor RsiW